MNPLMLFVIIFILFLFFGIRIVYEYKRALKFRFGKYVKILNPGFRWVIPLVETIQIVDIRVITINIVSQEVMTQDNVPCSIDGVVFFKINNPEISSFVLDIIDLNGKVCFSQGVTSSNYFTFQGDLSKGLYSIRVQYLDYVDDLYVITKKIVVY